ncbi:MAG: hypothetical protein KDB22_21165, partial [Planctomycetales bacterium]|nr:hypothetical protein [Planctomycetales bacterium]
LSRNSSDRTSDSARWHSHHSPRDTICRYYVAGPTLAAKQLRNNYETAQEVQFRLVGSTNPNAVPSCTYETLRQRQKVTLKDQGEMR